MRSRAGRRAGMALVAPVLGLVAASIGGAQESNRHATPVAAATGAPVAVVELFTSEGCSSCPPADDVLRQLGGDSVFPLAFHVDYWNRLGWRDPFSDAAYTERQRAYARVFDSGRVYTPQAIVQGRHGVVGSQRRALRARIADALGRAAVPVQLVVEREDRTLRVRHAAAGPSPAHRMMLALTESGLETRVRRGENRGRSLRHDHVVRVLLSAPLTAETTLAIPNGVRLAQASVVAFIQHPETLLIAGAARAAVR